MSVEPSTEAGVRRELLRLALHNSARSVLLQLAAVAIIVLMGVTNQRNHAALGAGAIGVVVAAWRLLISKFYALNGLPSESAVQRLQWQLEGNAALAGLMWVIATVGIYPALAGTTATTYVGMVLGSITVAAFFMTLVGRSFPILASIQVAALIGVSLFNPAVF